MFRRVFLMLTLFVLCSMPVAAATVTGNSGLINIPNADALAPSSVEASLRFTGDEAVVGVNFGLIPQVELGAYTTTHTNQLGLTVKGVLVPESREMPGIAVGLESSSAYLVFSRSFSQMRGHIGFGNGRFHGPFVGFSVMLNPVSVTRKGSSPTATLMVEHDGYGLNAGARIAFSPNVKADIAFLNMQKAMLGLSFGTRF